MALWHCGTHASIVLLMSDRPHMRLARWLEDQLAALGETPTELATRSGINRSVVARWKSGTHRPDIDNARRLAEAVRRPLLEVLVVAELVTEDEVKLRTTAADPSALSNEQLLNEIGRRLDDSGARPVVEAPRRTPLDRRRGESSRPAEITAR